MSKWRVGSSLNIEAHRLKNRLRQQRYRARKREEKAKRDGEIPVLAEMCISSLPSVSNGNPLPWHDITPLTLDNPEAKKGTSSGGSECKELDSSHHEVYNPIDTGSFQVRCSVRQEDQQSYAELLQSQAEGNSHTSLGEPHISDSSKIQNPIFLVDQECHVTDLNAPDIHNHTMAPPERANSGKSESYIMYRRLKNRERQRRYRARKRLEADFMKNRLLNQSELVTLQTQPSRLHRNARVHCNRKWKEDARRAHPPEQGEAKSSEIQSPAHSKSSEEQPQIPLLQVMDKESPFKDGVQLDCVIADETSIGRRDWKMDARNKVA